MTKISYEVFPPSSQIGNQHLARTLQSLEKLDPDFISVTCSSRKVGLAEETVKVANYIQNVCHVNAMAHLPARYLSKQDVDQIVTELHRHHIQQLLVLRGDKRPGLVDKHDFHHASDLIAYIHDHYPEFKVTGACYPEKHPESRNMVEEIHNLRLKVDAGCDQLITQLFLDNESFYRFQELCSVAGINVPIIAGIMPIVNEKQAHHILQASGVSVPKKFTKILGHYQDNPEALKEAGITYAIDQIVDLATNDVAGIHLYTMNRPETARQIKQNIGSLLSTTAIAN